MTVKIFNTNYHGHWSQTRSKAGSVQTAKYQPRGKYVDYIHFTEAQQA